MKLTDRQIKIDAIKADLVEFKKKCSRRNPLPDNLTMLDKLTEELAALEAEVPAIAADPPEADQAEAERQNYLVKVVLSDAEFMRETLEASEAADRGEGKPWSQVCREQGMDVLRAACHTHNAEVAAAEAKREERELG